MEHIADSKIETFKTLPTEQPIDLTILEGWSELEDEQMIFLCTYFDNYPQEAYSAITCGVKPNKVKKWKESDFQFNQLMMEIEDLHMESLAAIQYKESYNNSKIRHQTLQSFGSKKYKKESTPQKVINNNFDMNSYLKQLKS